VRLHVNEWGDPGHPRVVCLHGVQAHGRRFRRLAEERLASGFHVLAPDLRGHGRSTWDEPWTIAAHLEDLAGTFPNPAAWIGHSFGGRLVLELAAVRPELVERAVLLDPALVVPPDYAAFLAEDELAADVSFASKEEAVEARLAGQLSTPRELVEEEVREHLVRGDDGRFRYRYSPEAVAAAYLEVGNAPPSFDRLSVPTLVVAGAYSKFVSVGEAELFRAALGERFRLAVVPAGHILLWDAFAETADAIERFLAP
jgi:lipase